MHVALSICIDPKPAGFHPGLPPLPPPPHFCSVAIKNGTGDNDCIVAEVTYDSVATPTPFPEKYDNGCKGKSRANPCDFEAGAISTDLVLYTSLRWVFFGSPFCCQRGSLLSTLSPHSPASTLRYSPCSPCLCFHSNWGSGPMTISSVSSQLD
jgi:hypothetical protein